MSGDPTALPGADTKTCPYCAEVIKAGAIRCRYCRADLTVPAPSGAPYAPAHVQPSSPPPGYGTPFASAPPRRTNGFAVASLVLGIVWMYGIGSILALVFGYKARAEIDGSGGSQSGRGMAIAGIVLGWIGVGGVVLVIVLAVAVSRTSFVTP